MTNDYNRLIGHLNIAFNFKTQNCCIVFWIIKPSINKKHYNDFSLIVLDFVYSNEFTSISILFLHKMAIIFWNSKTTSIFNLELVPGSWVYS